MVLLGILACIGPSLVVPQGLALIPDDPNEDGAFGSSIATSGETVLVGSMGNGSVMGSVYVFDAATRVQLRELRASDGMLGDQFGSSVAIERGTAVVGAMRHDGVSQWSGAAYLFEVATGQQLAKLLPDLTGYVFGGDVDISGNVVIVGAAGDDEFGNGAGAAYLFNATTGDRLFKLTANDASPQDGFGFSVAISGQTAIIGTPLDGNGSRNGSAYLFDVGTGQQMMKVLPDDPRPFVEFGHSVAASGSLALVGAYGDDSIENNSGAAYLFDLNSGVQLAKLVSNDPFVDSFFGCEVEIHGDTAVIASLRTDPNPGLGAGAYLFDLASMRQVAKLRRPLGFPLAFLGCKVAIGEEGAYVSASGTNIHGVPGGSVRLYDADPEPDNRGLGFCFGDGSGNQCPCGSGARGAGCPNSESTGAQLLSTGNARFSASTFGLVAEGIPAHKAGLCIKGSRQLGGGAGNLIGDGFLCTTPQIRSQVIVSDEDGVATMDAWRGTPFAAYPGAANLGSETNYQWWYRDSANGCTGSGFNFSNAWAVTWLP